MVTDKNNQSRPLIVVKVGTSTLTAGTDRVSRGKLEDIARQLVELNERYQVILVSSGAIATARQFINLDRWEDMVESKQAMSAIGQPKLMQLYSEVFNDFGLRIAQCLMTYRDFENKIARKNTYNTIDELLAHNFIPIINENDTVSIEEILLGDNDKLSAMVAELMDSDILIIASDIDGLYDKNPHLNKDAKLLGVVDDIDSIKQYVEERENGLGTGGMTSKINSVKICHKKDIEVRIVNGSRINFIKDCLEDKIPFTTFIPKNLIKNK